MIIDDESLGVNADTTFDLGFNDWLQTGTLNRLLDDDEILFNCSPKRISDGLLYLCV